MTLLMGALGRTVHAGVWFVILVVAAAITLIGLLLLLPFGRPRERRHATRTRKLIEIIGQPVFKPRPEDEAVTFTPAHDVVPEGLGAVIMRRPHSPTTTFAYLTKEERALWLEVMEASRG